MIAPWFKKFLTAPSEAAARAAVFAQADGFVYLEAGTTAARPAPSKPGYLYWDTTLAKVIVFKSPGWTDMAGLAV